jgi:ribose 1,5-bisphosphokinase
MALTKIGPGALIAVCGPSGAGKDSLMRRARDLCDGSPDIIFPRRIVTRPMSDAEEHDTATPDGFETLLANGAFAVWWEAHGLRYALPASIDADIEAGRCVVCNVSRAMLPQLRQRYARMVAVLVTAPQDVLLARIASRARVSDGSHDSRLARSAGFDDGLGADSVIDNVGPLDDSARHLYDVIVHQRAITTA